METESGTAIADPIEEILEQSAEVSENDGTEESSPSNVVEIDSKPRKTAQDRINDLVRQRNEALQEAEFLRSTMKSLAEPPKNEPKQVVQDKPLLENFPDYDSFVEALTDWKVQNTTAQLLTKTKEEELTKKETLAKELEMKAHVERMNKAKEVYPDYDEIALSPKVPYTQAMADTVIEDDNGAEIAYYLGKNIAEAQRISQLPVVKQIKEIGKISARFDKKGSTRHITKAPEPISPVSGNSSIGNKAPTDMSMAEYANWRKQNLK